MTMNVLQTKDQIADARQVMVQRGVSALDSPMQGIARKLRLVPGVSIGDLVKSWDVKAALEFLEAHVAKDAAVADIGCFASEILVALHKAGYTRLTGVDLNPRLRRMPYQGIIKYEVSDFTKTPFPPASFDAITSISVIEHGLDAERLLGEMSRLLKPNGYFFSSFDYWPDKISTEGIKFFDMSWLIFSRQDVESFVATAATYGLVPVGDLSFGAKERPIECGGKEYTFAYLVLRKEA